MKLFGKKRQKTRPGIDFRRDDWFDEYLAYRKDHPLSPDRIDPDSLGMRQEDLLRFESVRHPLYFLLLHSGLIYGFPHVYPFHPAPAWSMNRQATVKLTLLDLLTFTALEHFQVDQEAPAAYEGGLEKAGELIQAYFRGLHEVAGRTVPDTLGDLLTRHVSFRETWIDWRRSGTNCHLFWDWYFFRLFLETGSRGEAADQAYFRRQLERRKSLKLLTMQLIAAAAHSDHQLQLGERILQHHFQKSAHFFTARERAVIRKNFQEGVALDCIDLPEMDWMPRRYWLDVSLMTLFADKEIKEAEEQYLQRLLQKLQLEEDDLLESKLALGGFLLRYGRRLPFFNSQKANIRLIAKALSDNLHNLREATHGEYQETVDMALVFGRLLQYQLGRKKDGKLPSEEEIAQALDQLKDLPKFLPFFSILFLPVPGITELYILLAYTIERMTGNSVRLLPSRFSRMVKRK